MILRRAAVVLLVVYGACLSVSGQESERNLVKPFLIGEVRSLLSSRSKITQSDESFNKKVDLRDRDTKS
ncbi:MAG TPA: hypothetical protein VGQ55_03145, partial [Pyrinomonadaceae bacterium]|nr:hypothetical protein [Pyrinomonadaceae bacterium]